MPKKITYKQSGVDIAKANRFVEGIGRLAASTMNSAILKRKGAFGALFSFDPSKYKKPVRSCVIFESKYLNEVKKLCESTKIQGIFYQIKEV